MLSQASDAAVLNVAPLRPLLSGGSSPTGRRTRLHPNPAMIDGAFSLIGGSVRAVQVPSGRSIIFAPS